MVCLPSCHKNAAKTALKLSATEGLIACFTGSFVGTIILEEVGNCCILAGDIALLGRDLDVMERSFLDNFGDTLSSLPPDVPIEK